jgi:hypothetical protein
VFDANDVCARGFMFLQFSLASKARPRDAEGREESQDTRYRVKLAWLRCLAAQLRLSSSLGVEAGDLEGNDRRVPESG